MRPLILHKILLGFFGLVIGTTNLIAQDNLDNFISSVVEGKTYYLAKANKKSTEVFSEKMGYYLKLVPAKYKVVYDTIVLSPALNGNLDTSNYFVETEVLILKEPSADWKTARVSALCMEEGASKPVHALCLLKMVPKYQIVNKKFFPFKNILDTTNTDFVIPARTEVVKREELVEKAKLERIPMSQGKPTLKPGEKLIEISAGKWEKWQEVVCPYGEFNDPKISDVQQALKDNGYNIRMTNKYDEQTKTVLVEFQRDNMLKEDGLSEETIQRLGVKRERLITVDNF